MTSSANCSASSFKAVFSTRVFSLVESYFYPQKCCSLQRQHRDIAVTGLHFCTTEGLFVMKTSKVFCWELNCLLTASIVNHIQKFLIYVMVLVAA